MPKKIFLWLISLCICGSFLNPGAVSAEENETLFRDSFESYGVDGSGVDENGKAVNPVAAEESGSGWFNSDAASKRGVIIFAEDSNHYVCLYKQNNIQKTDIAARLGKSEIYGNKQYTFGMRINIRESYGYYAAAGCKYEISAKNSASDDSGAELVSMLVNKDSVALSMGGKVCENSIGDLKWYELKTVISLVGDKAYVSAYINDSICVDFKQMQYSAAEIENAMNYLSVSADFTGMLDTRSKPTMWLDDIFLTAEKMQSVPLTASYVPSDGSMVTNPDAPLYVQFSEEIAPVLSDDISIDNGAEIKDAVMNEDNTGVSVSFSSLTEGKSYNVKILAGRPNGDKQEYFYHFTYTGNKEVYVSDWFDTYGVDGSGIDENGKTINPISAMEEYGKWYNREAASKRGAIILQNDDKIPGLNFFLQSQNKVVRTQMSTLLKSGGKELGEPKGVYEINTGFTIPYGSGDIKSVGLRDKCYAQIGLSSEDGKTADILKIDYNNGKNRIKFFDSEKTADLSENREYNVKIRIYPQNGAYTADVYIGDEEKLLNREPIQLGQLAKMNRLTVDVNGYDSPSTVRMFILNGIDFKCSLTPKLVSCSAAFKKIALKDNVITAEFDTAAPEEAAAYSIDNGAVIESAERVGECGVRLTVGGLKNGESYTLAFGGVKNSDGYGCLDTAVFEVEKKIEVSGVSLDGGKLKNGDNKVTAQLENTTGEQLGASLVILVCRETNGEYRIENAVIESKENIGRNDSITASFSTDGTQFVKAFLLDSADGMKLLYDEMIYR